MRLLRLEDDGEFSLTEYLGNNIPRYAILSHTWGADDEEFTFKDLVKGTGKSKVGYSKIQFCAKQAAKDGLQFFWVDTCCIDKSSSTELSEAINSMFHWYHESAKCYVYLPDVLISNDGSFQKSRWFTRGWTLQELLAPTSVEFFSAEGERLGDKSSLVQEIHDTTGISIQALQGGPLPQFSVDERMSWAEGRKTKREEDAAYSLLGIFDVHMSLLYGEGQKKAFIRLRKKIKPSLRNELPVLPPAPLPTVPFGRDTDLMERSNIPGILNAYMDRSWHPQTSWEALGGVFTSPPAVVSWGAGRIDIFGLGTNNQMLHKAWDGSWHPSQTSWEALGGIFTSPPAVVSCGAGRIDIFALGTDNQMFHKAWDGSYWLPSQTEWEALGGIFTSPPAVVSCGAGRIDIFALGTDNQMFHKAWDGSSWLPSQAGWEALGGIFTSPPAVVSCGAGRIDIFGLGTDNQMLHKTWDSFSDWMGGARGGLY
ncbi:hypothetical protein B0J11DRAFT_463994 [Dendryphion nanum]|uniref:Heterokaryon incompatibility domain-containing protein n=1 Tax=Dendryphion nanum TaxID=256645 RepID=A0A9P9IHK9_9PLEO|nr:hypothetical protein B0J11DRAFT_463994 [Dendryphion nanum]